MIITDYYRGERLPGNTTKNRYDITRSTGSYEQFETMLQNKKAGGHSFYFGDTPANFKFSSKERPDKAITKGVNISSVFIPDASLPYGFGDVKGSTDAILFIFSNDWKVIEIFIARGQRNNRRNLYHLVCDTEIDHEIEAMRNQAKDHELPKQ